jgi:hypothetical protein
MWVPQRTKKQQWHRNKGTVFSVLSTLRRSTHDKCGVSEVKWSEVKWSGVGELEHYWGSAVVTCFWEKLIIENGSRSGNQSKGNVRRWKPLPFNRSEDVIVDTSIMCTKSDPDGAATLGIKETNHSDYQSKPCLQSRCRHVTIFSHPLLGVLTSLRAIQLQRCTNLSLL